jgi:hypothetical protein
VTICGPKEDIKTYLRKDTPKSVKQLENNLMCVDQSNIEKGIKSEIAVENDEFNAMFIGNNEGLKCK